MAHTQRGTQKKSFARQLPQLRLAEYATAVRAHYTRTYIQISTTCTVNGWWTIYFLISLYLGSSGTMGAVRRATRHGLQLYRVRPVDGWMSCVQIGDVFYGPFALATRDSKLYFSMAAKQARRIYKKNSCVYYLPQISSFIGF